MAKSVPEPTEVDSAVAAGLAAAFHRNGYVRRQNPDLVSEMGWKLYKKGDEVRLVARDQDELERLRALLIQAGLKPGRPYAQGHRWRQPLYGRAQVARFLEMVEAVGAGI